MDWHPDLQTRSTQTPAGTNSGAGETKRHQVAFVRGGHTWRLTWDDGDEPLLLETLAALAASPNCPLDEFDRALVCQHLGPTPPS